MKITATYNYMKGYLPTKRCRKLRYKEAKNNINIEIREISKQEAPIALKTIYDKKEDYRFYNNKLYTKSYYNEYVCHTEGLYPLKEFVKNFNDFNYSYEYEKNENKIQKEIKNYAKKYIIIDNVLWEETGEPRYVCMTFGLGHNHGGTSLMIDNWYNSNISKSYYFNALERKKAIEYTKNIAINRGDTNDIKRIGDYNIEVFIPEAIKCNPQNKKIIKKIKGEC